MTDSTPPTSAQGTTTPKEGTTTSDKAATSQQQTKVSKSTSKEGEVPAQEPEQGRRWVYAYDESDVLAGYLWSIR